MNKLHKQIQLMLYEYVQGELDEAERAKVDTHLSSCGSCAEELENIKLIVRVLPERGESVASEFRSEEYWSRFIVKLEEDVFSRPGKEPRMGLSVWETLRSFLFMYPRRVTVMAAGLVAIVALTVWRPWSMLRDDAVVETPTYPTTSSFAVPVDDRLERYFRKSHLLLVGITNMKLTEDEAIDLSTERKVSRDLIHEARYLRDQPMDVRSAKLVDDLQRILIELANMKEQNDIPNIEIIRGGIHQENLLFKIRMAESLYDASRAMMANNQY